MGDRDIRIFNSFTRRWGEKKESLQFHSPPTVVEEFLKKSCWGGDLNGGSGNVERAICYEL